MENDNKRKNISNPEATGKGNDTRGDSPTDRNEQEGSELLDKQIEGGGFDGSEVGESGKTEAETLVWSFADIWNNNALSEQETKPEARDYLRGSDLGKPMSDVFLKMKGKEYTNPPNDRSLRKFEAGNIWEWIIKLILIRAGLYRSTQDEVSYQYEGLLRVSGHPDFVAGGKINREEAEKNLEDLPLPATLKKTSKKVVEYLDEKYPNGLEEIILEIKSTSGDFFNVLERSGKALKIHRLQLFNYLKSMDKERGAIIYISRDDCRILTIPVLLNDPKTEAEYRQYIEEMTRYYNTDELPPIEQPIVFDEDMLKLRKNSMLGWSPYLTKLYGFENQKEFDDTYTPMQASFARVLKRISNGDKMTDKNLEAIEKMKEFGFDPHQVAEYYKSSEDEDNETSE